MNLRQRMMLYRFTKTPFFPFIPIVPLAILATQVFVFLRLHRRMCRLEARTIIPA